MEKAKEAASKIVEGEQVIEKEIEKRLTVLWNDLPAWQQDNHYIHSGYRPASGSYLKSAKSLGYIHNETVNIYTHLIGAIMAVTAGVVAYATMQPRYQTATVEDIFVFSCFFLGAFACLGMSATYHAISNHSEEVSRFGNKLDYLGIVFMIWGSFIPVLYYGFQTEPHLIYRYWTMISTIAVGTATACVHPKFRNPSLRPVRAALFAFMGLSAVAPMFHGLQIYGLEEFRRTAGFDWVVLQGFFYLSGAVLYAARFPERVKPGAFDIWGSSHQIFHVLVVLAASSLLVGLVKAFDYEHSHRERAVYLTFLHKIWS